MQKNDSPLFITKASGEQALYEPGKLRYSLEKAGAAEEAISSIMAEIETMLYPGISTKKIYRRAYSLLRKTSSHLAAKYKLKKAIQELGPSGFPFEKFIGQILKHEGYRVQVGQIVRGHCVQHEVDVIVEKDDRHFMVECKFHGDQLRKCDVKVPLYIHSRFLDVEKAWRQKPGHGQKFHQGWIVTNTRFTTDAVQYGSCTGLNLVSWNYPKKDSLKERIDRSGLHPLTCLTSLTKYEKQKLLDTGIVLCRELCENEYLLEKVGVKKPRAQKVLKEARLICELKIQA